MKEQAQYVLRKHVHFLKYCSLVNLRPAYADAIILECSALLQEGQGTSWGRVGRGSQKLNILRHTQLLVAKGIPW